MTVKRNLDELRRQLVHEDQAYQAAVADFDSAAAASLGVHPTDLRCLEILLTQLPTALPSQLATALGLTSGSVTAMLDRLEGKGYLTRSSDPDDGRRVLVQATAMAKRKVLREIYVPLAEEGGAAVAHYTEAELKAVINFLRMARELYERHLARLRGRHQ